MERNGNVEEKWWAAAIIAVILCFSGLSFTAFADGWDNSYGAWRYIENNSLVVNDWRSSNGQLYYLGYDGFIVTDSIIEDKNGDIYYVDETGARVRNKWKPVAPDASEYNPYFYYWWYYFGNDGKAIKHTAAPVSINGQQYLFDSNGHMLFGLIDANGNPVSSYTAAGIYASQWYMGDWLYGAMKTNYWIDVTNALKSEPAYKGYKSLWIYFGSDGKRVANTTMTINGQTYTFDAHGVVGLN